MVVCQLLLTGGCWNNRYYWTIKEAFVKATGAGVSVDLRNIAVYKRDDDMGTIAVEFNGIEQRGWVFKSFYLSKDYIAALAIHTDTGDHGAKVDVTVDMQSISLAEAIEKISRV